MRLTTIVEEENACLRKQIEEENAGVKEGWLEFFIMSSGQILFRRILKCNVPCSLNSVEMESDLADNRKNKI